MCPLWVVHPILFSVDCTTEPHMLCYSYSRMITISTRTTAHALTDWIVISCTVLLHVWTKLGCGAADACKARRLIASCSKRHHTLHTSATASKCDKAHRKPGLACQKCQAPARGCIVQSEATSSSFERMCCVTRLSFISHVHHSCPRLIVCTHR